MAGSAQHTFTHGGSVFRFKNAENRDAAACLLHRKLNRNTGGYCA